VPPPRVATEVRLMLVSARTVPRRHRGRSARLRSAEAGRRRHRSESRSGGPSGGLLGHPQRGSCGRRLLGLRHRDGWQELLSGTMLTCPEPGTARWLGQRVPLGGCLGASDPGAGADRERGRRTVGRHRPGRVPGLAADCLGAAIWSRSLGSISSTATGAVPTGRSSSRRPGPTRPTDRRQ
jgi:hypothetical protein